VRLGKPLSFGLLLFLLPWRPVTGLAASMQTNVWLQTCYDGELGCEATRLSGAPAVIYATTAGCTI
jgi:hypothetical protein